MYATCAATYSRLGNRGYDPQASQQPYPNRLPYDSANDPTYSRLEQFQGDGVGSVQPQVINQGPPPQQNLMMQQQLQQQGQPVVGVRGPGAGGGSGMAPQQNLMMQQHLQQQGQPFGGVRGPGAGGGSGMAPQPANVVRQQSRGMMDEQYGEQRHQQLHQQMQSVNAHAFLGVPEQLKSMAAMPRQQQQLQQLAPAAPPKPKEPPGWVCPQCTLVNNPRRPGCELCSAPRPEDYVVPNEAPLAEFERKAKQNEELFEQVSLKWCK